MMPWRKYAVTEHPNRVPRALVLIAYGIGCISQAIFYADHARSVGERYVTVLEYVAPAWVPVLLWGGCGLLCLIAPIRRDLVTPALSLLAGLAVVSAFSYLYSWLWLDRWDDYLPAARFLGIAVSAAVIARLLDPPKAQHVP